MKTFTAVIILLFIGLCSTAHCVNAMRTSGLYAYVKGMTALDAVLSAGGFTEFASQNSVEIIRQEDGQVKSIEVRLKDVIKGGDVSKNVPLKPGDMISVKSGIF